MKPENSNHKSLKWRIVAFIVIFIVFTVSVLWLFQVVLLGTFYQETKFLNVKRLSTQISYVTEELNDTKDIVNQINKLLSRISIDGDTEIYFYAKDDQNFANCIYYSDNVSVELEDDGLLDYKLPTILWSVANRKNLDRFVIGTNDLNQNKMESPDDKIFHRNEEIIYGEFSTLKNGEIVLVIIQAKLVPLNTVISTVRFQLFLIIIILGIFGIFLSFVMGKFISKPLEDLNNTAKLLSDPNAQPVFDGKGYKEVMELSSTLNYATKEIKKSQSLQRDLISNVSHELRTPLTLIGGYSEMMKDIPSENTPENLDIIINETKRLNQLVNDVLELSKLQSNIKDLEYTKFNLNHLIEEVILNFSLYSEQNKININFIYDNKYLIYADEDQIHRVIYNFTANAINYSKEDNKQKNIDIKLEVINNTLRFSIKDEGIGIKEEALENIWNRYYKVYDKEKNKSIGSGLGLAIVKEILENHKFKYGVSSTYGVGTIFWFELSEYQVLKEKEHEI